MNARERPVLTRDKVNSMKTGGIDEASARYGLGKTNMRKVAEDAHAVIRIGRRYLVNFEKVDLYMNSISE